MKYIIFLLTALCFPLMGQANPETKQVPDHSNAVIVCENSLEMLQWNLEFITKAKHSIELSLCFTGGTVFRDIVSAVEKRFIECPDLQAYFLIAPVLLEQRERDLIKHFEEKYPKNFHLQFTDSLFEPLPEYNAIDNHIKCIIVDEHYYSVGGTNFDENLCVEGTKEPIRRPGEGIARNTLPGGMRDQDVVAKGPIAKELRLLFYKNYALWEHFFKTGYFEKDPEAFNEENRYFPLPENEKPVLERFESSTALIETPKIKLLFGGPWESSNSITQEYVRLIREAKSSIDIGNLYICPHRSITNSFKDAISRGVQFSVITNGVWEKCPTFANFIGWSNRVNYAPLFYGKDYHFWEFLNAANDKVCNTRVYEYRVGDVMYHKKVMVVDKRITLVGTYNLGTRSDAGDYEIVLVIDSEEVARDFLKVLERDKTFCEEITPSRARDWYFNPITSYVGAFEETFHGFL
jgi:phosphatidylserine/phosphatidylglycerophosphate/cardiolipin synthase-like enzyme